MKKLFAILVSISLLLSSTSSVAALEPGQVKNLDKVQLCEALQNKIAARIVVYKQRRDLYIARYAKLVERSETVIANLKEKNYDTIKIAKLETDLATLKTKIKAFGIDLDAAISKLEESNNSKCEFSEAKTLLAKVRKDVEDIKSFTKNMIRADIRDLKTSKK